MAPLWDDGSEKPTIVKAELGELAKPIMESKEESHSALAFARRWIRRSSEPAAWSNLAAVYATRQPPDLKRARRWYRRAALKGHDRGMFEYGIMLIQGEGGAKRPAQGRRYLERAAALGQIDALKVLTYALTHGQYSYDPSRTRALAVKRALRQALSRLRTDADS